MICIYVYMYICIYVYMYICRPRMNNHNFSVSNVSHPFERDAS
jgi:hypothetical protein